MKNVITYPYILITDDGEILRRGKTRTGVERTRTKYISYLKNKIKMSENLIETYKYHMNHLDEYNASLRKQLGDHAYQYTKDEFEKYIASNNYDIKRYLDTIEKYKKTKIVLEEEKVGVTSLKLFFDLAKDYCTLEQEKCLDGKKYFRIGNNRIEINENQFSLLDSLFDEEK